MKEIKIKLPIFILLVAIIIIFGVIGVKALLNNNSNNEATNNNISSNVNVGNNSNISSNSGNTDEKQNANIPSTDENNNVVDEKIIGLSEFDLEFLKMENQKANKIYSPLSIKYALKMLEDGAAGNTKAQISNALGNTKLTKYTSNPNMSLANALFVRETFRENIKANYMYALQDKYDAEVIFDSFETPDNANAWISDKTLKLINNLLSDISDSDFLLVNALGIDMEWKEKFLKNLEESWWRYNHETLYCDAPTQVTSHNFNNGENEYVVSGMNIEATINNYDIIKELGEENIRKIVSDEYRKVFNSEEASMYWPEEIINSDINDEQMEKMIKEYLDGDGEYSKGYMKEIAANYHTIYKSTDFSIYTDENIKAFSKDLKEYDGTTLQYVGIMPITEDLDSYIQKTDEKSINNIVNNLKELKPENFKEGVATKVTGYIPKFKFDYDLRLKEDLKQIGITDVFEESKANLKEITDLEGVYISNAIHSANIEFTQDGIKAAAVTVFAGGGGGEPFDYFFDIPVEEIDMTFDKPFMFLIRDKKTDEIWFMGTVYEPLLWENEPEKDVEFWG